MLEDKFFKKIKLKKNKKNQSPPIEHPLTCIGPL
jgi:hypothetical protein